MKIFRNKNEKKQNCQVLYPPGMSSVNSARPGGRLVYKGQSVSLVCSLQDLGRPVSKNYAWFKVGWEVTEGQ